MARDYKSRENQRGRRRHGGGSCFFWFLTGALLGALGVAVAWMMEGFKAAGTGPSEAPQQTAQPVTPRFDYHSILPEMEVVVPDDELASDRPPALPPPPLPKPPETAAVPQPPQAPSPRATVPPPAAPKPAAPKPAESGPKDGTSYLLQVASFKSPADAERLKARLALLGMSASIQRVTINGKDTYHRVRAGPYRGKGAANKARAQLSSKGLESITIKLK